jgi:hypothetical protein
VTFSMKLYICESQCDDLDISSVMYFLPPRCRVCVCKNMSVGIFVIYRHKRVAEKNIRGVCLDNW